MHYGTVIKRGAILEAETAARERHSHYYEPVGWLYRVEANRYSGCSLDVNDCENYYVTSPRLEAFAFPVERWTPCGATLKGIWSGARLRWVDLRPGAKQWASRTVEEAIRQLGERRRRQLWVLGKQVRRAEEEKHLAELFLQNDDSLLQPLIA